MLPINSCLTILFQYLILPPSENVKWYVLHDRGMSLKPDFEVKNPHHSPG